jgi:hypothetical protein
VGDGLLNTLFDLVYTALAVKAVSNNVVR